MFLSEREVCSLSCHPCTLSCGVLLACKDQQIIQNNDHRDSWGKGVPKLGVNKMLSKSWEVFQDGYLYNHRTITFQNNGPTKSNFYGVHSWEILLYRIFWIAVHSSDMPWWFMNSVLTTCVGSRWASQVQQPKSSSPVWQGSELFFRDNSPKPQVMQLKHAQRRGLWPPTAPGTKTLSSSPQETKVQDVTRTWTQERF